MAGIDATTSKAMPRSIDAQPSTSPRMQKRMEVNARFLSCLRAQLSRNSNSEQIQLHLAFHEAIEQRL
jgi:hypothetical protein